MAKILYNKAVIQEQAKTLLAVSLHIGIRNKKVCQSNGEHILTCTKNIQDIFLFFTASVDIVSLTFMLTLN